MVENAILPIFRQGTESSEVRIFENFALGRVRVVFFENEPHFCLSDLAKILEFKDGTNLKNSIQAEFELSVFNKYSFDTKFGVKEFTMINESQMYFVLMRSRSEKAKPFRKWVVGEVLPQIRKTGSYSIQPKLPTYAEALRQLADSLDKQAVLESKIQADAPKVKYAEAILSADNSQSVGDFARFLGSKGANMGQNRLFTWLKAQGYLQSDNMPFQKYIDSGYFELLPQSYAQGNKTITRYKVLITARGQDYFTKKILQGA